MRRLLEYQADQIEAVLVSHRAPVRVTGGSVLPRLIQFNLVPGRGVSVRKVQKCAEEVALAGRMVVAGGHRDIVNRSDPSYDPL